MSDTIQSMGIDTQSQPADAKNLGKLYIGPNSGAIVIHQGTDGTNRLLRDTGFREASEAEEQALRTIPEFSAHLDRVRAFK